MANKPDLKAIREEAEQALTPGAPERSKRVLAENLVVLLDYIDRLLEDYEKLTQREMSDLNLIDRLKKKLVEERANRNRDNYNLAENSYGNNPGDGPPNGVRHTGKEDAWWFDEAAAEIEQESSDGV